LPNATKKITKDKSSQLSNGNAPAVSALSHPCGGRAGSSTRVASKLAGVRPHTFEACKKDRASPNFLSRYNIYARVPIGASEAATRSVQSGGFRLAGSSCSLTVSCTCLGCLYCCTHSTTISGAKRIPVKRVIAPRMLATPATHQRLFRAKYKDAMPSNKKSDSL